MSTECDEHHSRRQDPEPDRLHWYLDKIRDQDGVWLTPPTAVKFPASVLVFILKSSLLPTEPDRGRGSGANVIKLFPPSLSMMTRPRKPATTRVEVLMMPNSKWVLVNQSSKRCHYNQPSDTELH